MTFLSMAVVIDPRHGEGFRPFSRPKRCKLQSFTQLDYSMLELSHSNQKLANSLKRAFEAATFHRSFSTPCLSLAHKTDREDYFDATPTVEIVGGHSAPKVRALVIEVAIAMASGANPVPISNGLGGAYLLRTQHGDNLAVAKPVDEEPLAFNNPKGFVGQMLGQPGLKRSIRVGETGIRELAAYLLDHSGFARVPPTVLVKISHVAFHVNDKPDAVSSPAVACKIASLQRFVDHDSDAGELGPSGFSVVSVHRIGILDIRLLNLDRHAGNMLVKNKELVPIDHGLCLPEWLDDPYFEWLHWPQASIPFAESEMEYISNLDPFKDAELLRTMLPSLQESSIRILVICSIFLQRATAAGLCLADIGQMMTRESCGGEEKLSVLENLCAQAKDDMGDMFDKYTGSNYREGGDNDDIELVVFENDDGTGTEESLNDVLHLPRLLQSPPEAAKPLKIPRFSSPQSSSVVALPLLRKEHDCHEEGDITNNYDVDEGCEGHKVGVLTKSVSFAVASHNHEIGGIAFGEMSGKEWESFLVIFGKVLPEAFQRIKGMGMKKRLGTSCEF